MRIYFFRPTRVAALLIAKDILGSRRRGEEIREKLETLRSVSESLYWTVDQEFSILRMKATDAREFWHDVQLEEEVQR